MKSDRKIITTLDITYNKMRVFNEFYNLINWPTNYDFYTVSNQLQEGIYRDQYSAVRSLASARFLLSPTLQLHTRAVTQLSLVFTQVVGLAFALYILFGLIARPLASFFYKIDAMERLFTAKTEIPDVLEDDGRVNPSPSVESLYGKPVKLSSGSTCCLCLIT